MKSENPQRAAMAPDVVGMDCEGRDAAILGGQDAWSDDAFLGGRLHLRQPRRGYRAGSDAVLLAAATPARAGEKILDVGCGVGAAMLCLARRVPGAAVTGLEIQSRLAAAARENAARNGLEEWVGVVEGDLTARPAPVAPNSFDHVIANPPFHQAGRGMPSPNSVKRIAHLEERGALGDWIDFCLRMARPGGTITMINRAERLAGILKGLEGRAGGIVVCPLWPMAGKAAKSVIVQARKGAAAPLRLSAGLMMHGAGGEFTAPVQAVLRHGEGLVLSGA